MLTQEERKNLANLLFPELKYTAEELEEKYPPRNLPPGAKVTRLGPSPTGFIHLGNLYGAFVDERLAHQSDGVFFLRIEDTDDKRYVEGAVKIIIDSLRFFGINFDEGAGLDPVTGETIPTGSRGKQVSDVPKSSKRRLHSDTDYKALYENCISSIQHKDDIIAELRDRLKLVEQENKKLFHGRNLLFFHSLRE